MLDLDDYAALDDQISFKGSFDLEAFVRERNVGFND